MPIDLMKLRETAEKLEFQWQTDEVMEAADYIDTLRKQLYEAHSHNQDSERLDWLELQAHHEYSDASHRSYFRLPRICSKKAGENPRTLRQAIDDVRRPGTNDE